VMPPDQGGVGTRFGDGHVLVAGIGDDLQPRAEGLDEATTVRSSVDPGWHSRSRRPGSGYLPSARLPGLPESQEPAGARVPSHDFNIHRETRSTSSTGCSHG
jgi:hypothetical protein